MGQPHYLTAWHSAVACTAGLHHLVHVSWCPTGVFGVGVKFGGAGVGVVGSFVMVGSFGVVGNGGMLLGINPTGCPL